VKRHTRLTAAVAVAALTAVAGCGSSKSSGSGGSTSITVWHGYTDVESAAITKQVDQWNIDNPTRKVNLVFDGGNDSALQKTTAALAAGKYPDIAYEYGSSATSLVTKKQLVDLTDTVKDPTWTWSDFYAGERQAATVNGKVVGLPALVDNLSLVYNKKLFDAAGVAYPTPTWTWDDFRAAAKKLTNAAAKQYGWAYVNDASEDTVWRYEALLWQSGGDILDSTGKAAGYDSPAGLKAMTLLHDMAVTDKSVYLDTGNGNYLNLFNSGKIAMLWTGPWDVSSINADVSYGVQVLPANGTNHASISGPDSWMVFDNGSKRVATAKAFLQWLLSPSVHLQWDLATGDLPVRASEATGLKFADYLAKYPADKVFVDNMNNVTKVRPNITQYPEISASIGQAVQAVLLGKSSPQAALDGSAKDVKGIFAGSQ
jgi:multiple sugar transport system substrate-binding protein